MIKSLAGFLNSLLDMVIENPDEKYNIIALLFFLRIDRKGNALDRSSSQGSNA